MRLTHPADLPCYFIVKTPNKGAFYLCALLFFLDLCKYLLTFSPATTKISLQAPKGVGKLIFFLLFKEDAP
jgi:hypothetical protein